MTSDLAWDSMYRDESLTNALLQLESPINATDEEVCQYVGYIPAKGIEVLCTAIKRHNQPPIVTSFISTLGTNSVETVDAVVWPQSIGQIIKDRAKCH